MHSCTTVHQKGFLNKVKENGKYFNNGLVKLRDKYPKIIKEVRGMGLLIGLALHKDQTKFIQKLLDNKFLTIRAAENVVRLLPPFYTLLISCKCRCFQAQNVAMINRNSSSLNLFECF